MTKCCWLCWLCMCISWHDRFLMISKEVAVHFLAITNDVLLIAIHIALNSCDTSLRPYHFYFYQYAYYLQNRISLLEKLNVRLKEIFMLLCIEQLLFWNSLYLFNACNITLASSFFIKFSSVSIVICALCT